MKKTLPLISLFFLIANLLSAQDFWLQPKQPFCKIGDTAIIYLKAGRSLINKVVGENEVDSAIFSYYINGKGSINKAAVAENGDDSVVVTVTEEATHVLTAEFENTYNDLDIIALKAIIDKTNINDSVLAELKKPSPRKMRVHWSLKTMFQSGYFDYSFTITPNLLLDITPDSNPLNVRDIATGMDIRYKVMLNGVPLRRAEVKVVHTTAKGEPEVKYYQTNKKGYFSLPISMPSPGDYIISCMYIKKAPANNYLEMYYGSFSVIFGKGSFFAKRREGNFFIKRRPYTGQSNRFMH